MKKVLIKHIFLMIFIALPTLAKQNQPLDITEIAQGVYLHTSFRYIAGYGLVDSNGLIVVDGRQAYIIDTPWSEKDTQALLSWIQSKGYVAVASISTHFHEDRTAGIKLLNSKLISTYTSELTKNLLVREGKASPTQTFNGNDFNLGDGLIQLFHPGAGHTEDNIVVWLPKSKVLFAGCIVRSHEWENLGYVGDASIDSWATSIRNIKSKNYDINMVVPGHGRVGKSDMLDHTIRLAESTFNQGKPSADKKLLD